MAQVTFNGIPQGWGAGAACFWILEPELQHLEEKKQEPEQLKKIWSQPWNSLSITYNFMHSIYQLINKYAWNPSLFTRPSRNKIYYVCIKYIINLYFWEVAFTTHFIKSHNIDTLDAEFLLYPDSIADGEELRLNMLGDGFAWIGGSNKPVKLVTLTNLIYILIIKYWFISQFKTSAWETTGDTISFSGVQLPFLPNCRNICIFYLFRYSKKEFCELCNYRFSFTPSKL